MAGCMSIANRVGKKVVKSVDRSSTLFINLPRPTDLHAPPTKKSKAILYDSAYNTPLSVYIDVVCDNKLESLIIAGLPTVEELEEAKLKICSEYAEIAGGGENKAFTEVASSYYSRLCGVIGLEMAMKLLLAGRYDAAIDFLNRGGIRCVKPETRDEFDKLLFTVEMKYKNRLAKLKEAGSRYKSLSKTGEKPTRKYYNRLLVILSTCEIIKMQLNPKQMTVAEFAEYINIFNEYQNGLKIKKYGKR